MDKNKQNTAIICLSPYSGGMEIDSIKLAKKLSPYTNITLIAQKDKFIANQKEQYVGFNGIELETIKFGSNLSLSLIFKAREIIKKRDIKNIIFFGASELKSLYFSFLGLDINLIVRHGTTKSRPKKDWFHRLIYSNVNYHVSICKHLMNNVRYIIPFGKNTQEKLIYSSLKLESPKQKENNQILKIVHVGRIAEGKGQSDAIKACEVLVKNNIDFSFDVVGGFDEKYRDEFMTFFESCPYKNKINLVGFSSDVQKYLSEADIFLFPSYGEGLSNAFLEALGNNLYGICYENTSFPELQEIGLEFSMAKDRDIEDLEMKLLDVVESKKYKSASNYQIVNGLFNEDREINEYMEILR